MYIKILFIILSLYSGLIKYESRDTQEYLKQEWKSFYKKYFNIDLRTDLIEIPEYQEGFNRVIIVAVDLSYKELISKMSEKFDVVLVNKYLPAYLDENIISKRDNTNSSYAIRIRDNTESGEDYQTSLGVEKQKYTSVSEFIINDITLKERLIYELKYHDETGDNLDKLTFTVCSGSFFRKDSTLLSPAVGYREGRGLYYPPFVYISECYASFTLDGMFSRNVISY